MGGREAPPVYASPFGSAARRVRFSRRNLFYLRRFAALWPEPEKVQTLSAQIGLVARPFVGYACVRCIDCVSCVDGVECSAMTPTLDISLLAYPTLTEAARLLGVSASTLSRRDDLACERMGERDKRVPAGEVMRLAAVYRKRSLSEVAAELIGRARERSPEHAEHVQEEVERFFEQSNSPALSGSEFLAEAERALPAELYERVRRVYRASEGTRPPALLSADRQRPGAGAAPKG
jgi:hypothetical protein